MLKNNLITKKLKATVKYIIVAFIFSLIIVLTTYIVFKKPINKIMTTIELISIKTNKSLLKDIKINNNTNTLESYPAYGSNYGTISIPSIDVNLSIYYGDDLEILKKGVGHTAGTYFPGEGGSIVYMAHNSSNMLRNLPELKKDSLITIKTVYGTYNYRVYEGKIIEETDFDALPFQKEKEILMIYTCYPTTSITYTKYRYIIYASKVEE